MTEREILQIQDDTERADAVAAHLDHREPASSFLDALCRDSYDVIRAEALDCAISGRAQLDEKMLRQMAQLEQSVLVRGRLKLYLQLAGMAEELALLRSRTFAPDGREEPWDRACDYCAREDGSSFLALARLMFEDDYGVAGVSLDLLLLLAKGVHRKLLETMIAVASSTPGVCISRERLEGAGELLAGESAPPATANEIKAQLS